MTSSSTSLSLEEDALLKNKANRHILENLDVRTEKVRQFLHFFKPEITPEIVPIHDVYGPTGWDPDIQALVVSKETLNGAEASTSNTYYLLTPHLLSPNPR